VPGDAFIVLTLRAEICQKVISEALNRPCERCEHEWDRRNRREFLTRRDDLA
jgi:hypothetical protein